MVTPILSSFLTVSVITYTTPVSPYMLLAITTAVISLFLTHLDYINDDKLSL